MGGEAWVKCEKVRGKGVGGRGEREEEIGQMEEGRGFGAWG